MVYGNLRISQNPDDASVGIPAQIEGKTVFESSSLPDLGDFELNTDYSLDESRTYIQTLSYLFWTV